MRHFILIKPTEKYSIFGFVLLVLVGTNSAQSATIVGTGDYNHRNVANAVIGHEFTVGGSNITVNALGVYDRDQDGLSEAHDVGIWLSSGGSALATVTVPAGTGGTLEDVFRYMPIADLTLLAGTSYTIGAHFLTAADSFVDNASHVGGSGSPAFVAGPGVTLNLPQFTSSGSLVQPTQDITDGDVDEGRWAGGSATFFGAAPPSTPEPSAFALSALALVAFGFVGWRRR